MGLICFNIQTGGFKNKKKKKKLPIYIPLTAVLAAWLGYEWTHSSYPRLISAEQPPLSDPLRLQSFPLSGLRAEIRQCQHRPGLELLVS